MNRGENVAVDDELRAILKDWWNDTMRKDYRTALEEPEERRKRFEELVAKLTAYTYHKMEQVSDSR